MVGEREPASWSKDFYVGSLFVEMSGGSVAKMTHRRGNLNTISTVFLICKYLWFPQILLYNKTLCLFLVVFLVEEEISKRSQRNRVSFLSGWVSMERVKFINSAPQKKEIRARVDCENMRLWEFANI